MRLESALQEIERTRRVRDAIGIRTTMYNDPQIATTISRAYAANPHLNPEILVSLALGGASEQMIHEAGKVAERRMLRDGVDITDIATGNPFPRTNVMYDGEVAEPDVIARMWRGLRSGVGTAVGAVGDAVGAVAGAGAAATEAVGGAITGLPGVGDAAGAAGRASQNAIANMANYSYGQLKGFTRAGVMLGESGKQFYNAIAGQMAQEGESPFAFSGPGWLEDVENDVQGRRYPLLESLGQVGRGLAMTDAGLAATDPRARASLGTGFLASDEFREAQADAQRDLLGTVTGRYGEPVVYTVGRSFADALSDTQIIRRDSAMYNIASGAVDGTLTVLFDGWNAVGGATWGAKAVAGLPKVRNGAQYNDLARLARYADERGQPEVATSLMREALESIGVNDRTTNPSAIRRMFNSMNETDVAIRAALMDEAGIIREGSNVTIMIPEFAKFLTQGTGRRLVNLLVDDDNPRMIRQRFSGGIGHRTAVEIADTKDPTKIVQLLARAISNPAEDVLNYATKVPHIGVFHMAERGLTIRRTVGSHTKLGNYLPQGAIIAPNDPVEAIRTIERLASVLPVAPGAGRIGQQAGAILPSPTGWRLLPDFPALQRARQNLPKSARYNVEEVDNLVNRVMRAYASDDPGQIKRGVAEFENVLERMFENLGWTLGQAQDLTPWHQTTRQAREFLIKDIGNGVPQQSGPMPALWAQLISQPITLIDPSELPNVLRRTGRTREILRHVTPYAENQRRMYDVIEKMEDAITAGRMQEAERLAARASRLQQRGDRLKQGDDALKWINAAQGAMDAGRYYWKLARLMRLAYIGRVVPEEQGRVLLGGVFENPLDYLSGVFNKRYTFDAVGNRFTASSRRLQKLEGDLDELVAQQSVFKRTGQDQAATAFEPRIQKLKDEILAEFERWNDTRGKMQKALIGRDPARNVETLTRDRYGKLAASGQLDLVSRTNAQQIDQWVDGLIGRLAFMNNDVPSVAIARLMAGKTKSGPISKAFNIGGVRAPLARHIREGRVGSMEEGLAYYFVEGPGRQQWREYAQSLVSDGRQISPDSLQDAQAWLSNMVEEINLLTGGNRPPAGVLFDDTVTAAGPVYGNDPVLLDLIATGLFNGKRLTEAVRTRKGGVYRKNTEALEYVRKFADDGRGPVQIYSETGTINGINKASIAEEIVGEFFSYFYGVPSDILARSPAWKRLYWNNIADLIRTADAESSATLLANARKANLPDRLMKRIEDNAGARLADATVEEIDRFASVAATNSSIELFYDSSRRGATMDALRFVVAFGDAWKEVYKTWAMLFVRQKGKPAVRISQGVYAGERLELGGPGDIYGFDPATGEYSTSRDGSPEGFFWKDPTTGERKFTLPLSGQIISRFAGIFGVQVDPEAVALDAPIRNLNIAGSIFPGFMPIADQAVQSLLPDDPAFNDVRNFIFPFGEPPSPETPTGRENLLQRLIVPAFVQRMAVLFGGSDSPQLLQYLSSLLNNAEADSSFQNTRNHALKLLMSEGNYDSSAAGFKQLERDADRAARAIHFMRGVAQFIGPASPGVRYSITIGELFENDEWVRTGNAHSALLAQELNDNIRKAIEEGRPVSDAMFDMLDKYGPFVWLQLSANSESKLPGAEASKEWFEWYQTNTDVVDMFPLVGSYFGPTGDYDQDARSGLLARGVFALKTPRQLRDDAAQTLAYAAYSRFRDGLPPEAARTKEQRDMLSNYRIELETYWGVSIFSQEATDRRNRQILQLEDIVNRAIAGEALPTQLAQSETGQLLVNYMAARESSRVYAQENLGLSSIGWRTSVRAAGIRDGLRALGNAYAAQDPGFGRMWQFLLEREMVDSEEDVTLVQVPSVDEAGR